MSRKIFEIRVVTHGGPAVAVLFIDEDGETRSVQAPRQFTTNEEAYAYAAGVSAAVELLASGFSFSEKTVFDAGTSLKP